MDPTQSELTWRKSSHSGANGSSCVEVAELPGGGRAVRNSKRPDAGLVEYTRDEWDAFIAGVKDGEFD
jgi:hypothetical protein